MMSLSSSSSSSPVVKSEKAALFSSDSEPLLPLYHRRDLRQVELERAEAVWQRSENYRGVLVFIYIAAFLFFFQFLAGTAFVTSLLEEIRAAQVPQTFP